MGITSSGLEAAGFERVPESQPIVATFHSLHVYSAQGILVDDAAPLLVRSQVKRTPYALGLGLSVNNIAQELVQFDLVDDETEWASEPGRQPPYVLVHFGPTGQHTCTDGWYREYEDIVMTHDAFPTAHEELRALEDEALPALLTSLRCARFGPEACISRLLPVSRNVYGLTPEAMLVRDMRFEFSAEGVAYRRASRDEFRTGLESAAKMAKAVNRKAVRFFRLATEEDDPLRCFLYFFMTLEVETHKAFQSVEHAANIDRLLKTESRIEATSATFFERQLDRRTNLLDRFMWCAICAWPSITDADVAEFKRLKKVRDDIAHGSVEEPPAGDVHAVEALAVKLLRCRV